MEQANPTDPPPPRLDEFPPGSVVVVIDVQADAEDAARSVEAAGEGLAYVLKPEEVLAQDAARQDEAGAAQRAWRTLTSLVSDQGVLQQRYVEHARAGRCVLVAAASDRDQADAMWASLRAFGAHDGVHVEKWTLRELVSE